MKNTIIITNVERQAFFSATKDVVAAQDALKTSKANAEAIAFEIIASHGAPPVMKGGTLSIANTEGRVALVYDAQDDAPRDPEPPAPESRLPAAKTAADAPENPA